MSSYDRNLAFPGKSQYLTVDASSDTVTLSANIQGVWLYADTDCWVSYGPSPAAAAPGAEKTAVDSFFMPKATSKEIAVPKSTSSSPMKIAAIQDTAAGTLQVQEWKFV